MMSKSRLALFVAFCCVAIYGCSQNSPKGIDVSHHQGDINWNKVAKEPIGFVYIKATEGETYVDSKFKKNIVGAKKVGLPVGVYHYFRMTSGAHKQFKNFYNTVKKYKIDLIPMVDVETSE